MQNRPDKTALLAAVARFLEREVKPAIKDPSLAFRVLIAANLASIVAGEIGAEDATLGAEIERLRPLLPEAFEALAPDALATREGRQRALEALNRELCERIRRGAYDGDRRGPVWDHVILSLKSELSTSSPRYDTSLDIE